MDLPPPPAALVNFYSLKKNIYFFNSLINLFVLQVAQIDNKCMQTNFTNEPLDYLPPPPSASELMTEYSESQPSLTSLPPPPTELRPIYLPQQTNCYNNINNNNNSPFATPSIDECDRAVTPNPTSTMPQAIYSSTMKSAIKAPPYKSPPPYSNSNSPSISTANVQKSVTFALDSPVLLRRKVCFEDEVMKKPQQLTSIPSSPRRSSAAPPPPPRTETTRLSTISSPKRLSESASNPPTDFLHDLQRVMRKKWQVAQKCAKEPSTTPQEVLGFRDFEPNVEYRDTSHFYRETSNVSNWVNEHYGSIAVDGLYENLGVDMNLPVAVKPPIDFASSKKRPPPPPPPKRSTDTRLTHRT